MRPCHRRSASQASVRWSVVICAIGTLSLGAIGANIGPLIIMAVVAIGWSVFVTLVLGRRMFRQHWFEHPSPSLANPRACSPAAS
jgi:hypothetical protein